MKFSGPVVRRAATVAAVSATGLSCAAHAGTWSRLPHNPPAAINLMLLMTDGTVIAANNDGTSTYGRAWYRLTPDSNGSYLNGTWTTIAQMADTRLYYSSQVLKDGRVFVAGGEYGTGTAKAELYNLVTNSWTQINPPNTLLNPALTSPVFTSYTQRFFDADSEILPNGNVLISPVMPMVAGQPLIYNPTTNTWTAGPNFFRGSHQDEASWVKLPDDTILTIDPFGTFSERYNPASNTWINDGVVPVATYDPFGHEIGGAVLLPNGKAFYLGSTGNTALYTPSGTTAPGVWAAGPVIPGARGTPDAPAASMVTGHVLCAVSPVPTSANHFPSPTTFLEYDPVSNSFAAAPAPVGASDNIPAYQGCMLDLPDGTVMYSHMGIDVYVYTPAGAPLVAGKPTIQSITANGDGSYHLSGLGLNGISEGATYGDDYQMNTNYPIVRLHHSNGNTYFGRTFNWSDTSVMTGSRVVTTEYRLPGSLPAGSFTLQVVANGNASDPVSAPVVDVHPAPQNLCAAGPAAFTVSATGIGPVTYQWRRGTNPLTNTGNISGAFTPTLTIDPVGPADIAANYNCVVSNALGSATSNNAALTMQSCCDTIDFNGDGLFPDTGDIDDFLSVFSGGPCSNDPNCGDIDFNNDTLFPDATDIDSLLSVFSGGPCL